MTSTHNIFLRPVTSIYFGRPGALPAGEVHVGVSWFPPPISAFQGMIRTKLLQYAGVFNPRKEVEALVGTTDELPEGWSLKGPFPAHYQTKRQLQIWLPTPSFLLPPLQEDAVKPVFARPMTSGEDWQGLIDQAALSQNGSPLTLSGAPGEAKAKPIDGWVSSRNLFWAVSGGKEASWRHQECSKGLPPFVKWETRPGLAREKNRGKAGLEITGRAQEGMLYFLKCLRFSHSSGLVGWFKAVLPTPLSPEALNQGPILAGKKGGVIAFEKPKGRDRWWERLEAGEHLTRCPIPDPALVWIILLSPGCWRSLEELKKMLSVRQDIGISIRSILSRPPIFFGGFSMLEKRQRPALPWYPPGTSILVELKGKSEIERREYLMELNNRAVLADAEHRPFGYGHVLTTCPIEYGGNNG